MIHFLAQTRLPTLQKPNNRGAKRLDCSGQVKRASTCVFIASVSFCHQIPSWVLGLRDGGIGDQGSGLFGFLGLWSP